MELEIVKCRLQHARERSRRQSDECDALRAFPEKEKKKKKKKKKKFYFSKQITEMM